HPQRQPQRGDEQRGALGRPRGGEESGPQRGTARNPAPRPAAGVHRDPHRRIGRSQPISKGRRGLGRGALFICPAEAMFLLCSYVNESGEWIMIGYVTLGTNDLARAAAFYDAIAAELETPRMMEYESFIAWGKEGGGAGIGLTKPFDG